MTDDGLVIKKLEAAGIVGRGGAGFPTHLKWLRLKESKIPPGYVGCNASEGELNVFKDAYILEHYPEKVIEGMVVAMDFLRVKEAYFNINRNYYEKFGSKLREITDKLKTEKGLTFNYFIEEPSYIGGETGALLNAIEGKRTQPRLSPPSPSMTGIKGKPVLLNNVETFYDVARVMGGSFKPTRLATLVGPIPHPGVYEVDREATVMEVLKSTGNDPDFDFFVQVGGAASGIVINREQAKTHVLSGCGAVEVYGTNAKPRDVLKRWFDFYEKESCGKCTPCREGSFQLKKLIYETADGEEIPWNKILPIVKLMKKASFCDLGKSLPIPVESYFQNVMGGGF